MWELTDYPNTRQVRIYDIEAISLPIVYNKFGDHDPNGLMYVLKKIRSAYRGKPGSFLIFPYRSPIKRYSRWLFGQMWATPFR